MKKLGILFTTVIMIMLVALSASANDNVYKVGDIIQFGTYPQTEVKDEALIAELNALAPEWNRWTSYGYYSGTDDYGSMVQGDWMRYVDIKHDGNKYRGVKFTQYRPYGTNFTSLDRHQDANGYSTNTVYWFIFEPIDWRVLDPATGLVMCETIIDSQPYSNTVYFNSSESDSTYAYFNDSSYKNYASDYETSSIRQWLNDVFYNTAFTDSEKKEINTTTLNNDGYNTSYGTTGYEALDSDPTNDKIFLLSYNEARNSDFGFDSNKYECDKARQAQGSDYAQSQGLYVYNNRSYWLLRSPGGYSRQCCRVKSSGDSDDCSVVDRTADGVRPALRFNLSSEIFQPEHQHSYISRITTEPTCTTAGTTTYTCTCGDTYTETIPATNHPNATTDEGKAPTTTEVGYTAGKYCPDCKTWIEGHTEIPKIETCQHTTKNGQCSKCKAFIVEQGMSIELQCTTNSDGSWVDTTNIFNISKTGKSTVSVGGYYSCTHYVTIKALNVGEADLYLVASNNAILSQSKIIVIEHTHNYALSTKTPTCTDVGAKTYSCTCGDTYTESIPATNHPNATTDPGKAPTATEVGYTEGKYCPDCKIWIEGHAEIPKLEEHKHSYTSTVTKEPTCWREGETTYTCTCGDSYTEAIAKLDHEYRPWETKKNPTCIAPGLEWSYCLLCDNDFEREIPATGHTIIDYTRRATPDSDGAYVTACDVCNEVFKSVSFGRPAEYKLSTTTYTYNGKAKTPKLTVTTSDGKVLKKGVDYTVELPKDRTSVGTHTYRVVFMGDYLGETKVSYQILPGKTSSVSASQSTDYIKLSWKKVSGATGYRVYQYNSSTGKYKTLKTLTGTSYTVKNLKAGTTYKFAVKAYTKADGETLWAASSKTLTTATKPATPTVKATAGSGKATLSWSKISGATGYVVYMMDEFGDYVKVGSTKKTSYTVTDLDYGKTYNFRVKAYKTAGDKNVYSGHKTVKVTTLYPAVYVTPSGKRYHYDKECAGKNATKTTLANAKKTKTPCKTCVL